MLKSIEKQCRILASRYPGDRDVRDLKRLVRNRLLKDAERQRIYREKKKGVRR